MNLFVPQITNVTLIHLLQKSLAHGMKIYDAQVQTSKIRYDNMSESGFIRLEINYIITAQESHVLWPGTSGSHRKVIKLQHYVWPLVPCQGHQRNYKLLDVQAHYFLSWYLIAVYFFKYFTFWSTDMKGTFSYDLDRGNIILCQEFLLKVIQCW